MTVGLEVESSEGSSLSWLVGLYVAWAQVVACL